MPCYSCHYASQSLHLIGKVLGTSAAEDFERTLEEEFWTR